jgi:ABC-type Zn uptake system ZnuABC Zn-binding protein ZnuA
MAALQQQIAEQGVQAIFVGTTVNPRLAEQVAQDTGVQVVILYSDSLSAADGGSGHVCGDDAQQRREDGWCAQITFEN